MVLWYSTDLALEMNSSRRIHTDIPRDLSQMFSRDINQQGVWCEHVVPELFTCVTYSFVGFGMWGEIGDFWVCGIQHWGWDTNDDNCGKYYYSGAHLLLPLWWNHTSCLSWSCMCSALLIQWEKKLSGSFLTYLRLIKHNSSSAMINSNAFYWKTSIIKCWRICSFPSLSSIDQTHLPNR